MSFKEITIGTETFNLPLQGANPPWGEELSDLIEAMGNAINNTLGPNDITETAIAVINTAGVKNITGLAFNPIQVKSAEVSYNISRQITKAISSIPTGTGVISIPCLDKHNLFTGNTITIANSNSTPNIDGTYQVTKVDANIFTIDIGATNITVAGTAGNFAVELVESGLILVNYGQQGWSMNQIRNTNPNALVNIEIASNGQFTYEPVVLEGTSHIGTIKFIAKALITASI